MKIQDKILPTCICLTIILASISPNCSMTVQQMSYPLAYNLTQSMQNAKFAALAFCPSQCIQKWNCQLSKQLTFVQPLYITDPLSLAAGFIGYKPDTQSIVISWRGTNSKVNWYEDFNFQMVIYNRCKDCYVHTGFFADFLTLQQRVYQRIDYLVKKFNVKKIINTGHSLGAAISLITGIQLKVKFGSKYLIQVHNFGQPRVGNVNLAQFLKLKLDGIYRVVHNRDIVPHVPFEFIKYVHPPNEIFFDENMKKYTICSQSGQDSKCSNQFFPAYQPSDHDFYFIAISDSGKNCKVSNLDAEAN